MKSVFSIIWKVIAVAMLCVGVYLLIQVMGEAESVIESYEELTGNSIGATSSIKIAFLRDYIRHTGNTDILVTLNVSPAEVDIILKDDLEPSETAEPDDDRQQAGSGNSSGGGSGNGGSGGSASNPSTSVGTGTNFQIDYVGLTDGYMKQNHAEFENIMGNDGSLSKLGCGIVALYNAYLAHGGTERFEDIIFKFARDKRGNSLTIDSAGHLTGYIGTLDGDSDASDSLSRYIRDNYFNPGNVVTASGTVNSALPGDGEYIVYYNHADKGAHWVYCNKVGNSYSVANPATKEGQDIGNREIRKYIKIS